MRPSIIHTNQSGELLPIKPCNGCRVIDGDTAYELEGGKKLCLPALSKQRILQINKISRNPFPLYILWILRTEKDQGSKQ